MKKQYEQIIQKIKEIKALNAKEKMLLPDKWEKVGDVLLVKLKPGAEEYFFKVAEIYAEILKCKSILQDMGVKGVERAPITRFLWGDKNTETIHLENGIKFRLDPSKVMFSSGNISERIRMANVDCKNETIVDGFAGIGYFCIPMAVYGKPEKIYACEINPIALRYLSENIEINDVSDLVEPLLGDFREVAPKNCADRVVMGYLKETSEFLPVACRALKKEGGIIHYHNTCPAENFPNKLFREVEKGVEGSGFKVSFLKVFKVKSYAPGIYHTVLDCKLSRN
jgi:tRNA wybutosine-synthesizing protein 2